MNGLHLIGDLTGCRCDPQLLLDGERFKAKCVEMVAASGLTTMDATFHQFEGSGFTAMCAHLHALSVDYEIVESPQFDLQQIFLLDPNGIRIEVNIRGESSS